MSTLVIAEHDNSSMKPATLNSVTAAQAIGGDIDILVVGSDHGKSVALLPIVISGCFRYMYTCQ